MRRHGRRVLALGSALVVLMAALSLVFYVLDGSTAAEQEHRAQVWGTVFAILIVVPTALAWSWRAVAPNPDLVPTVSSLPPVRIGRTARTVDLAGTWYTAWQSYKDGQEVIAVQPVRVTQHGERLVLEALERGRPVEDGGYLWAGELRLWDNETLMGWYASTDAAVRSKGTLYLVLHPQGLRMAGRWVGLSYDGQIISGSGAMARTDADARRSLDGSMARPEVARQFPAGPSEHARRCTICCRRLRMPLRDPANSPWIRSTLTTCARVSSLPGTPSGLLTSSAASFPACHQPQYLCSTGGDDGPMARTRAPGSVGDSWGGVTSNVVRNPVNQRSYRHLRCDQGGQRRW